MTTENNGMYMPVVPQGYGYGGRAMNGRYVSRDGGSYADGYSRGYSEAMNQQSGHWPMPPYRY